MFFLLVWIAYRPMESSLVVGHICYRRMLRCLGLCHGVGFGEAESSEWWQTSCQLSHSSASWLVGPTLDLIYITLCFTESGLKPLIIHTVTSIKNKNINNCCQNFFLTLFMILNPFHCVSKTTVRIFFGWLKDNNYCLDETQDNYLAQDQGNNGNCIWLRVFQSVIWSF